MPAETAGRSAKRVGLVVVHGIGEQRRGETLRSVMEGLQSVYGPDGISVKCQRPEGQKRGAIYCQMEAVPVGPLGPAVREWSPEVRVYEAYWAPVLSGDNVLFSFDIRQPQQFVWYPLLNWRRIRGFSEEYPWWVVWRWTLLLIPLGALLTAAYYALGLLLDIAKAVVERPRESEILERLAATDGGSRWLRRLLTALRKDREEGGRRNLLDRFLDTHIGDIFNYVNSAGGARTKVPKAAADIYRVLHGALARAAGDACTEIQILAHSLGTVITYHALTTYRDETERLISLDDSSNERPLLTRLHTIGSPLEKIRFFWPKLLAPDTHGRPPSHVKWDNFKSRGDPVAGVLGKFNIVPRVDNHWVNGAGGLLTAHKGYRKHPSFLKVFGPAVTGRPSARELNRREVVKKWLFGAGEAIGVPLLLGALAAIGVAYMYVVGWVVGWGAATLVAAILGFGESVVGWTAGAGGLVLPGVLVPVALVSGFLQGRKDHRSYWREGVTLERRRALANDPSVYRKPGNYVIFLCQLAILGTIAWIGLRAGPEARFSRAQAWFLILVLLTAFAVLAGRGITGYWRGIMIDSRNKMSLSRLQFLAWTLLILSALLTAVLTNVGLGSAAPLRIVIPKELWVLMGITIASAVASPALLNTKRNQVPNPKELAKTAELLKEESGVDVDKDLSSVVVRNTRPEDARWGDLLKGDESGNAATVDLGKIQMFFFTFVLVLGYGAALTSLFGQADAVSALPPIDDSMNTLLGISHTGYLATKGVPHSRAQGETKAVETSSVGTSQ